MLIQCIFSDPHFAFIFFNIRIVHSRKLNKVHLTFQYLHKIPWLDKSFKPSALINSYELQIQTSNDSLIEQVANLLKTLVY